MDERFNQTIKNMLAKFANSHKDTWSLYVDTCVFAYNTSRHDSSKISPFEVMFGRRATLPVDVELQKKTSEELLEDFQTLDEAKYDAVVVERKKHREERLKQVKANIVVAQKKQKEYYDQKRAMPKHYKVGALVLLKDHTRKKRKGGALDLRWHGPFTIHKVLPRGIYALADDKGHIRKATGAHLKVYRQTNPTGVAQSDISMSPVDDSISVSFQDSHVSCNRVVFLLLYVIVLICLP